MNNEIVPAKVKGYHPVLRTMSFLLEQKIALLSQIHQYCFPNQTLSNARKTVSQLLKSGFVSSHPTVHQQNRFLSGYQLTQKGFEYLLSMSGLNIDKIQLKSNYKLHDVALTDIRLFFAKCKEAQNFLSENVLQSKLYEDSESILVSFRTNRSDAAVQIISGTKAIWISVEFERSDKTDSRLRERFRNWYQTEDIKGIFLIAEDDLLKNRMIKIDQQTYPHLNRKVYMCSYTDLLGNNPKINFESCLGKKISLDFSSSLKPTYPILDQNLSNL